MFQFRRFPAYAYLIQRTLQAVPRVRLFDSTHATQVLPVWVAPFGNLRITGYLLLPEAYRSLSRPSSAPDAKAFPLRSFQLDLSVREILVLLRIMQASQRLKL